MQATLRNKVTDHETIDSPSAHSSGMSYGVRQLRRALRGETGGRSAVRERAEVDAFVEALRRPLLRYCEGLARQSGVGRSAALATDRHVDAEDLAQEAWAKALRYLAGAGGDRVDDDDHFRRLLRRTAKTLFLDRVTKGRAPSAVLELDAPLALSGGAQSGGGGGEGSERTRLDTLIAPPPAAMDSGGAAGLFFLYDERYAPLLEMLFTDEERFHRTYRRKHQRRPRQYQAFVLYQLGMYYRDETGRAGDGAAGAPEAGGARLMEELLNSYVTLLGIPADWWRRVAAAAEASAPWSPDDSGEPNSGSLDETILDAVNAVCGTNVRAANMLAVLRYELNQFVAWEKEGAR